MFLIPSVNLQKNSISILDDVISKIDIQNERDEKSEKNENDVSAFITNANCNISDIVKNFPELSHYLENHKLQIQLSSDIFDNILSHGDPISEDKDNAIFNQITEKIINFFRSYTPKHEIISDISDWQGRKDKLEKLTKKIPNRLWLGWYIEDKFFRKGTLYNQLEQYKPLLEVPDIAGIFIIACNQMYGDTKESTILTAEKAIEHLHKIRISFAGGIKAIEDIDILIERKRESIHQIILNYDWHDRGLDFAKMTSRIKYLLANKNPDANLW